MGQTACKNGICQVWEKASDASRNSAIVFIKPHAVNIPVHDLVQNTLKKRGVSIVSSGRIDAETIDRKGLIDIHYGAIAARALKIRPCDLVVQPGPKADFEKLFGIPWESALAQQLVFNARDAARKLGIEPLKLSEECGKTKRGVDQLKFGGGFYVAKVRGIYVVNGFYEGMRAKFTAPGTCIQYFEVEWDPASLPWDKFRGEVIGATNPKEAAAGSMRNTIFQQWEALGLREQPDTGDNAVHASASPFEGLAEKANWLSAEVSEDPLGKALSAAGLGQGMIKEWMQDPAVFFEGKRQSLFDLLEDLDSEACVGKARDIRAQQTNSAIVFVKPHAVNQSVQDLVRKKLEDCGISIVHSGRIDAGTIDEKGLIDTHYGAIAARALRMLPTDLVVQAGPKADFKRLFGVSWDAAVERGLVCNARDAAAKLGMTPLQLSEECSKTRRGVDQLKFGGGFYVARLRLDQLRRGGGGGHVAKEGSTRSTRSYEEGHYVFVVNGFYEGMRAKFTAPGSCIQFYQVEWDSSVLPWEKFRGEVVGATNPREAAEGSIRNTIFKQWKSLGLAAEPDTGDNAVHASAGAFEGLAERANWLAADVAGDPFGEALIRAGIPADTIGAWMGDPAVLFDGRRQSLFDLLEDLDSGPCLQRATAVVEQQKMPDGSSKIAPLEQGA
jgi:nucleoside diphosphate kinase